MAETTVPIPGPPGLPLIGNVNDIDPILPLISFMNMAEKYGRCCRQEDLSKADHLMTNGAA